ESLEWGPVGDLGANILEGIRGIKSNDGPDLIVWGSSNLTSVLLEQGLVDEVLLLVYPVLLGPGQTLLFGQCRPSRIRSRQHEGHGLRRAHERLPTRWIAASRINLMPNCR